MKNRFYGVFVLLMVLPLVSVGQSPERIKENPAMIWGEATSAAAVRSADMAMRSLIGRLSYIVKINPDPKINRELLESYKVDIAEQSLLLTSAKGDEVSALRYMHSDSIENIFIHRETKIKEMLSMAESAEARRQIDIALRNLTWVEILLRSIPYPENLMYRTRGGEDVVAKAWAAEKVGNILAGLDAEYSVVYSADVPMVEVSFTYCGKPVRSLDYRFFNGKEWSGIYSAKDGRGVVENPYSVNLEDFKVKYESSHEHMLHIDSQIMAIKGILNPPPLKVADTKPIKTAVSKEEIKDKILSVLAREERQEPQRREIVPKEISAVFDTEPYEKGVRLFCESIDDGTYMLPDTLFADEGYSVYEKLIKYGRARLLNYDMLNFYQLGDEIYCRSIPMVFSYRENNKTFVEDIVLTFNLEGKITNITFSLDKEAARDVVSHENWPEEARIILVSFLENYKTAYALERLDYISSIFDDEALIITGRVLKNVKTSNEMMNSRYVTLTKQDKVQYISNLKRVFDSNEFINISFKSSEVLMLGKGGNMYGIQLSQEYYSSNYADKGYLFLMVDLTDYTQPIIHVRTWQAEPDDNFGIIGPHHF